MFNNISTNNLLNLINNNMVIDLPITRQDDKLADKMYGPNICDIKGKTVNKKVDHVVAPITDILRQILKEYKRITRSIDVVFINGVKFHLTVS